MKTRLVIARQRSLKSLKSVTLATSNSAFKSTHSLSRSFASSSLREQKWRTAILRLVSLAFCVCEDKFLIKFDSDSEVKMTILKIWYYFCILFCLYSIHTLVEDSHQILYKKIKETKTGLLYLACENLEDIYPGKKKIDLKKFRKNLYKYYEESDDPMCLREEESELFEKLILNRTKTGGYFIFKEKACLIANDENEVKDINYFFLSLSMTYFAIDRDTFNFVEMKEP